MVDDALAASGLECLNGGGTTEEVDIFSLSLCLLVSTVQGSFVPLTSLNGRARELSATLTSVFLQTRVVLRKKQIRSEIRSRVEETVLDNNSKQFDRAIRKQ